MARASSSLVSDRRRHDFWNWLVVGFLVPFNLWQGTPAGHAVASRLSLAVAARVPFFFGLDEMRGTRTLLYALGPSANAFQHWFLEKDRYEFDSAEASNIRLCAFTS